MMQLVDDGSLDTVFECDVCNHLIRYTYTPSAWPSYEAFVAWAKEDAAEDHECDDGDAA